MGTESFETNKNDKISEWNLNTIQYYRYRFQLIFDNRQSIQQLDNWIYSIFFVLFFFD